MKMRLGIRSRSGWHRRTGIVVLCVMALASTAATPAASDASLRKGTPNDPYFEHQWALQQIRAPQAWKRSTGKGASIAIIDTGIDSSHEDLVANVVPGRTFEGCPDGCGTGDYREGDTPWLHGTATAGIAAATGDNGLGIVGVAPRAKLMSVMVRDQVEEVPVLAKAIRWAADNGADVINLSVGYEVEGPAIAEADRLSPALAYAVSKGVVVVAAAGNDAHSICKVPSGYTTPLGNDGVICVVATDRREVRAAYSSGPMKRDLLAVAAPGGSTQFPTVCGELVLTTWPEEFGNWPTTQACPGASDPHYDEGSGTSAAAPHVSGVAALLKTLGCNAAKTVQLITSTARNPLTEARGEWGPIYGYGIIDADAATTAAAKTCRRANE